MNPMAIAPNSSSTSLLNDSLIHWVVFLNSIELCVLLVAFLISAFNLTLLSRTALLHPNLKCILLVQSAVIGLYECFRFIFVLSKFVFADAFYHGAIPVQIVQMALMPIRNKMGHVLVAERVFATINFRKYTENRSTTKQFAICWIGILLGISIWNMYVQRGDFYFINLATFVTSCIFFALGFAEILSMTALHLYNLRKYQSEINFTLNERFQRSSVADSSVPLAVQNGQNLVDIRGQKLLTESEMQIYFQKLEEAWK
ncbi:hypothetical protein niasHT_001394 [Heterodera trifolii]|uniref:Uncharacterized protein n=1 Tax=Heterodera trifolii TaxID=157864 RepID=A0ABD2LN33_9BILA